MAEGAQTERQIPMKQNAGGIRVYRAIVTFTVDYEMPDNVWSEAVERSIRNTKQMVVSDLVQLLEAR